MHAGPRSAENLSKSGVSDLFFPSSIGRGCPFWLSGASSGIFGAVLGRSRVVPEPLPGSFGSRLERPWDALGWPESAKPSPGRHFGFAFGSRVPTRPVFSKNFGIVTKAGTSCVEPFAVLLCRDWFCWCFAVRAFSQRGGLCAAH